MLRLTLFLLASAGSGVAQFSGLATTQDGGQVFFVTPLRERGSDQVPHEKVFAWTEGSLHLLFQRAWGSGVFPAEPLYPSAVSASGDGSIVAFDVAYICVGTFLSCSTREVFTGVVLDRHTNQETRPAPHVRVSRNGRYVLGMKSPRSTALGPPAVILDRMTGRQTELRTIPSGLGDIASNGTAVLVSTEGLSIARTDGSETLLVGRGDIARASIDDSGSTAIFEAVVGGIFAISLTSASVPVLIPGASEGRKARISADGGSLVYLAPQLFFSSIDGVRRRQLAESVSEAALSGDGRVAWAATIDGRLLKLDTETEASSEMLAPPVVQSVTANTVPDMPANALVPGSLIRIGGFRLGNRVEFDGVPGALVSLQPQDALVQVPWESKTSSFNAVISVAREDSTLEAVAREFVTHYESFHPGALWPAIHEDWKAFVSSDNPARPGEIIHIYASGLGPVDCPLHTGDISPLDRLCRTARPAEWTYWWTSTDFVPAEILFTGMAPGSIGVYQIDARVPANVPVNRLKLIADRNGFNVAADFPVATSP